MRVSLSLCFLLLILGGCKRDEPQPETYLRSLSLTVEPLATGISLKWGPVFYFEEGMYPGPTPVNPTQYEIYLSDKGENNLQKVAIIDGNIREYVVRNQPAGQTIYAKIKAVRPGLESSESAIATTNTGKLGTAELLFPQNTPYISTADWSGSSLVYSTSDGLFVMRSDGSTRKLKSTGWFPVLSPDGRYVAFLASVNNNTSYTTQLFIEEVESGTVQMLDSKNSFFSLEWSHDGKSLAYFASGGLQGKGIWTYSLADRTATVVHIPADGASQLSSSQIDWSPDDRSIVAVQEKTALIPNRYVTNLIRIPVGGGNVETLLVSNWRDEVPTYSPDGKRLAFISYRSGYPAIWIMDVKTATIQQITGTQESLYFMGRLDWLNNSQLTYSARLLPPAPEMSLKKVTLP